MHGIAAAASRLLTNPVTSYANTGGTGNRTSIITVTTNGITWSNGVSSNLVNGATGTNASASVTENGGSISVGTYIQFQFVSPQFIDAIKLIYTTVAISMGNWEIRASNDGSNWDTLSTFAWSDASGTVEAIFTNPRPEGYLYYRVYKNTSGDTFSTSWFFEVEFRIAPGAS